MVGGLCGLLLAVGLAGWHVMANAGEPGRRAGNAAVAKLLDTAVIADRMLAFQGTAGPGDGVVRPCRLGNPDAPTPETLVTGDSHAMALAPAFERIAVDARQRIDVVWGAQCPPLVGLESLGADPTAPACRPMNDRVLQYVRDRDIRRVVLVARWSLYTDGSDGGSKGDRLVVMGQSLSAPRTRDASRQALSVALRRTVEAYRAMGASVVLVADVPWQLVEPHRAIRRTLWEADPAAFLRNAAVPRATHQRQQAFANQLLASVSGPDVTVVNLDDVYCENDVCPIVEDGASRYRDRDHLSVAGAIRSLPLFRAVLSTGVSSSPHAP